MPPAAISPRLLLTILAIGLVASLLFVAWQGDRGRDDRPPALAQGQATGEATASTVGVESGPRLQLLVPAYFYPSGRGLADWDRLIKAAARTPLIIVLNPASGPGEEADPNYLAVLRRARKAGARVIGYIPTLWGKRPAAEVRADIDRWVRLYPEIEGAFFDQQAGEVDHLNDYAAAARYARDKIDRALVVTNPGSVCAEEFFSRPATDAACVFETGEGFTEFQLPPWSDLYQPQSYGAMPYGVADAEAMRECIRHASDGRIGLIYVTDGKGTNPWDHLPDYWEAEVDAVRVVNQHKPL